ncbi:MAG: formimidoylglutamate deiminase [Gemmatimonadales bacterium]
MAQILEADLTWIDGAFEPDIQVEVTDGGVIGDVGLLGRTPSRRLVHRALVPGMINAHSHAFQRALRGRGETFPQGTGTFWTWREAMYQLVARLDDETFYQTCLLAFREMLAGGITTVGEFHYLHHSPAASDFAYDRLVLQAARDAGIRIVLLNVYYRTGGIGQPLTPAQRRFETASLDGYWNNMAALGSVVDTPLQSLGVAAHSIRAVGLEEMAELRAEAGRRGLVFHMHVEEQRQEIDDSIAAYGHPPMQLLNELFDSMDRVTGVHCTHTRPEDMERFLAGGGTVCMCPTTEANLGDGIADLVHLSALRGRVCLGTDSNARISMMEEMRWVEYVQRLAHESRGVLRGPDGDVARPVFDMATVNGAYALGLEAGLIATGAVADFVALDLDADQLIGADAATLLPAFICGSDGPAVAEVCVGGRWLEP